MARFVKIGGELLNLDAVTRVSFVENQSGISDRIVVSVGAADVIVDSGLIGRKRMEAVRERLLRELAPDDWDPSDAAENRA